MGMMSVLKRKNGVTVLVLTCLVLVKAIQFGYYLAIPNQLPDLLAFAGYLVVLSIFIISPEKAVYPLLILLLTATLGLINMTLPISLYLGIGVIRIHLEMAVLLGYFLVQNKELFRRRRENRAKKLETEHARLVERFTEKFKDLSDDEIESKLRLSLSDPAKEALRKIQKIGRDQD
ncbi:MAG: hypothetical protein HWE14_03115 [Flavobacteriia bacterium]|nr:hypothetical protein [Flavobacteriia bacterium]